MTATARHFTWDATERIIWTVVEVVAGMVITALTPLDKWWAAPIAAGLALLKALAAKQLGNPASGATLPAAADPATAPAQHSATP